MFGYELYWLAGYRAYTWGRRARQINLDGCRRLSGLLCDEDRRADAGAEKDSLVLAEE